MRWYYISNFRGDVVYGIVRCNDINKDFYQKRDSKLSRAPIFNGNVKDSEILRRHASVNIKEFLFRKGLM